MLPDFQSMWDSHLGYITAAKNRIKLLDSHTKPVYSAPYQAGFRAREIEKVETDKMLEQQVIEPVQMERAVRTVFALKKDGTLLFCVNYRELNAVTKRDSCYLTDA